MRNWSVTTASRTWLPWLENPIYAVLINKTILQQGFSVATFHCQRVHDYFVDLQVRSNIGTSTNHGETMKKCGDSTSFGSQIGATCQHPLLRSEAPRTRMVVVTSAHSSFVEDEKLPCMISQDPKMDSD